MPFAHSFLNWYMKNILSRLRICRLARFAWYWLFFLSMFDCFELFSKTGTLPHWRRSILSEWDTNRKEDSSFCCLWLLIKRAMNGLKKWLTFSVSVLAWFFHKLENLKNNVWTILHLVSQHCLMILSSVFSIYDIDKKAGIQKYI